MRTTIGLTLAAAAGLASTALAGPWQLAPQPGPRPTPASHPTDAFPFSDNFNSYPVGPFPCVTPTPGCTGPNGWALWYAAETGGPQNGVIDIAQASSGPNSLRMEPITDIVQMGNISGGQWVVRAMTYFASTATGTPRELYFIVMDSYTPITTTDHWSIQIRLDGDSAGAGANQVLSDIRGTTIPPGATSTPQTLIYDQWVEIRAEIDLVGDHYTVFYNNMQVYTGPYTTAAATPGTLRIACLDLYSNGVSGAFYDDVSIQPLGGQCYPDCNMDHALNVNDFVCFQSAFAAQSAQPLGPVHPGVGVTQGNGPTG